MGGGAAASGPRGGTRGGATTMAKALGSGAGAARSLGFGLGAGFGAGALRGPAMTISKSSSCAMGRKLSFFSTAAGKTGANLTHDVRWLP